MNKVKTNSKSVKSNESIFVIRNISEAGRLMAIFLANGYEVHINDVDNEGHKMFEVRVIG